jgi:hypothetical protein
MNVRSTSIVSAAGAGVISILSACIVGEASFRWGGTRANETEQQKMQ